MGKVTDPALLAQLGDGKVTDPALLAQLGGTQQQPGMMESLGRGTAQGATLGFGDEAQGAIQALGMKALPESMGGSDSKQGLADLYREQRDVARRDDEAARAANPKSFIGGELAGGILPAIATAGGGSAPAAGGFLRALARSAVSGAKWGAVTGLGDSKSDLTQGDVGGALADTGKGALLGAGVGSALTTAGAAGKAAINGVVKLDPSNMLLRAMGVRNLTLGQAAPKSWFNSIEQSAESLPILGDTIKAQRQAGRASWQNAVLNEARAPGAGMVQGTGPADTLAQVADTFDAAYKPIAAEPVEALVSAPGRFPRLSAAQNKIPLNTALQEAASDPSVRATDDVRKSVASFLDNASTALPRDRALTAGDLISVRSQIRSEIRSEMAGGQPDYAAARLLRNAEDAVSSSLHEQLPPDAATALRATDAQYSKLMRVTDAVRRSGDQPGGFTPAQLSAAVRSGAEKNSYAQGGGGALRALAAAGRTALDTTSPPTGQRLLTLGLGTAALPVTASLAAGATTDVGKRLLTGMTMPQMAGQQLLNALSKQRLALEAARRAALIGTTESAQ